LTSEFGKSANTVRSKKIFLENFSQGIKKCRIFGFYADFTVVEKLVKAYIKILSPFFKLFQQNWNKPKIMPF
jgi:hypothetical protein